MAPSETIRRMIERSPLTVARIAELSSISPSVLYRFIQRERTMKLKMLDAIAPFIESSITSAATGRAEREAATAPKPGRPRGKNRNTRSTGQRPR